jgi:TctA family transporter
LLEDNLRRALSLSDGSVSELAASPVSITLWVMTAAAVLWPLRARLLRR